MTLKQKAMTDFTLFDPPLRVVSIFSSRFAASPLREQVLPLLSADEQAGFDKKVSDIRARIGGESASIGASIFAGDIAGASRGIQAVGTDALRAAVGMAETILGKTAKKEKDADWISLVSVSDLPPDAEARLVAMGAPNFAALVRRARRHAAVFSATLIVKKPPPNVP